jgi:F-type H+-transporting ATPase subunit gamma
MAVDLQKLKRKMRGVISTRQVTRALQMVSAMKMRKAQEQSQQSMIYRKALQELVETFETSPAEAVPDLAVVPSGNKVLAVTFGSDRGLCGPYNANLLSAVAALGREVGIENLEVRSIGIKVGGTLRRRGYKVLGNERRPHHSDRELFMQNLSRELLEAWQTGEYKEIVFLYSSLRGMTVIRPQPQVWLPIAGPSAESLEAKGAPADFIDEPSPLQVLAAAVRRFLSNEILSAILQSEASEHVARMMAMDNATRNAEELYDSLKLTYNKARQAKITQEICEIVAGANAIG